jgi:helicase required for RNAi-mediated heterochromatin assembly 1
MLKSMPNGTTSRRPPPTITPHVLIELPYQKPANPPATSRLSEYVTDNWQAYVNGGAAADDAEYLQKSKEEEAKYLEDMRNTTPVAGSSSKRGAPIELSPEKKPVPKIADSPSKSARLIELSPEKKAVSKNASLLIDLDISHAPVMGQLQQSYAGAASYKGKGKGKVKTTPNFLD